MKYSATIPKECGWCKGRGGLMYDPYNMTGAECTLCGYRTFDGKTWCSRVEHGHLDQATLDALGLGGAPPTRPAIKNPFLEITTIWTTGCHPKCTVGAPCHLERCENAAKADAREVRATEVRDALDGFDMSLGTVKRGARAIDVAPADPLAAMLSAGGVCVMRGRRW